MRQIPLPRRERTLPDLWRGLGRGILLCIALFFQIAITKHRKFDNPQLGLIDVPVVIQTDLEIKSLKVETGVDISMNALK